MFKGKSVPKGVLIWMWGKYRLRTHHPYTSTLIFQELNCLVHQPISGSLVLHLSLLVHRRSILKLFPPSDFLDEVAYNGSYKVYWSLR